MSDENKRITITKVVTRNFVADFLASIQNLFGQNLTSYEKMMNKGIEQIEKEIADKQIELKWYRYQITQLLNGSIVIMLYGDKI
jgi:hypothetical protein